MYIKNLKLVLLVSAAALSACATNVAKFTPIDIASNSVRRTDALSGVSEVLAPRVVAVLGRRAGIKGQAQLRTAGPFTDDKDHVHEGGAYLDVSLKYSSATPNPAEARIYDQASWPGGEPALFAGFGASVLDCREDIRAIPRYEYTPIYGAFGYGHIHDDHCGHEYGLAGWGVGYGHYGHGHVHDDDCGHVIDGGGDTVVVSPTTDPRPVLRPVPRPDRPRVLSPGDIEAGPRRDPDDIRPPRPFRPNAIPMTQPSAASHASKRVVSRPRPDTASSKSVPKVVSRPAPTSRAVSKSKPSVNRPVVNRPSVSRSSVSKSNYTPSPSPKSSERSRDTLRRQMDYYPRDPSYQRTTDYVVRRRCGRQENLRIFVSRERLDAAEVNGLVLYLRPRGGQEEVLSLPPNYITGFKLAAWSPQGPQLTIPGKPLEPTQEAQASTPNPDRPSASTPIIYGKN